MASVETRCAYTPVHAVQFLKSFFVPGYAPISPFFTTVREAREIWDDPDMWVVKFNDDGVESERLLTLADAVDYVILVRSGYDPQDIRASFQAESADYWPELTRHLFGRIGQEEYTELMRDRERVSRPNRHRSKRLLVAA
jgi:hypothetical protein